MGNSKTMEKSVRNSRNPILIGIKMLSMLVDAEQMRAAQCADLFTEWPVKCVTNIIESIGAEKQSIGQFLSTGWGRYSHRIDP